METLNRDTIQYLAHQNRFALSDEEADWILEEFEVLMSQLDKMNEIDTENIEPMVYPNETATVFMREDVVEDVLSAEDALKNVPHTRNGFVVTKKVLD